MRILIVLIGLLSLTSCAAGQTSNCPYRNLIGKDIYSADVEAVRASGKEVRILYPDSFIGFQKNENRINLIRDEGGEVAAVSCG